MEKMFICHRDTSGDDDEDDDASFEHVRSFKGVAQSYELNSDTKITIGHTEISGTIINDNQNRKIYGWFGLPFAQPPLGDLRWRAPRNFEFDSSNFDASKLPNRCMQVSNAYDAADGIEEISVIGSEDCLYLNVFELI